MDIRRSKHPEADRLATLAILFLERYSGTYRTRAGLQAQVEKYLDNEYRHDLKWFKREKDLEWLVDMVKNFGGVVIVELPPLPSAPTRAPRRIEEGAKESEGEEGKDEK